MARTLRTLGTAAAVTACLLVTAASFGQEAPQPPPVEIPAAATTLEGLPSVRIDSSEAGAIRRVLGATEAAQDRLTISVVDGEYFWTSRGNRPLRLSKSGEFTYLSSTPGQYVRLTRFNDRITYVEHVDQKSGSVTWWGELRFIVNQ